MVTYKIYKIDGNTETIYAITPKYDDTFIYFSRLSRGQVSKKSLKALLDREKIFNYMNYYIRALV